MPRVVARPRNYAGLEATPRMEPCVRIARAFARSRALRNCGVNIIGDRKFVSTAIRRPTCSRWEGMIPVWLWRWLTLHDAHVCATAAARGVVDETSSLNTFIRRKDRWGRYRRVTNRGMAIAPAAHQETQ